MHLPGSDVSQWTSVVQPGTLELLDQDRAGTLKITALVMILQFLWSASAFASGFFYPSSLAFGLSSFNLILSSSSLLNKSCLVPL